MIKKVIQVIQYEQERKRSVQKAISEICQKYGLKYIKDTKEEEIMKSAYFYHDIN